jgi:ribosome maturation factor RimP
MMISESERIIREVSPLAEPFLDACGMEMVDVEFLSEHGRWILRVYIDKEGGVNVEDCARVSRELGHLIEAEDVIDYPYVLEVSSPGLNRRLRKERDFVRSIGKMVKLTMSRPINNRKNFTGRLTDVKGGTICVAIDDNRLVELPLGEIRKARLEFEFNR